MEKELLYWVFSTIVQAWVALLALVGMVGIYWISKLDEVLDKISHNLRKIYNNYFPDAKALPLIADEEFVKALKEKSLLSEHSKEEIDRFQVLTANFICNYEEKQKFKEAFKGFAKITIIVITASLIFLGITTFIAKTPHILIGLIIAGVIFLSLWSLIEAFRLIKRAIIPELFSKEIIEYLKNSKGVDNVKKS